MPISLSRRDFLRGSLAGGAAAMLPRLTLGAPLPQPANMDHIALLSDVHVSGGLLNDMSKRLSTAVTQVLANQPDKVMVCGDCAHLSGTESDYQEYTRRIGPLVDAGLPVHMTLGNHDDRDRFWKALPRERPEARVALHRQSMVVEAPQANWILLDSLKQDDSDKGEIGPDQMAWLAAKLDTLADKPAIIMVHHDVVRDGKPGSLKDAAKLLDVTRNRRQVKAIFFGHTHVWSATQDKSGIHLVNLPATGYTLWLKSFIGWVDCRARADYATLTVHALENVRADGQELRLQWRPAK